MDPTYLARLQAWAAYALACLATAALSALFARYLGTPPAVPPPPVPVVVVTVTPDGTPIGAAAVTAK